MANNQYVNKVEYAGQTLIDITDTTATESDVLPGKSFYKASGAKASGSLANATQSTDGLMSSTDKTKLDGIASGATANVGTITGITMNGASKGTSGVVDLGTVITEHQDISGKVTGPASATANAVAIFNGTGGKTIKDSGFTIGKSVPSDAKFTDTTYSAATTSAAGLMSAADKTKLNGIATGATANTGTVTKVSTGAGLTGGDITSSGTISINGMDTSSGSTSKCLTQKGTWASFTNNAGTVTSIKMNNTTKSPSSGVVDLGTVITEHQDISGKVTGPASATANAVAIFNGTGGKTIKNSGYTIGKSVPSDAKFTDTTYSNATTSAAGLMSATDKTTLNTLNSHIVTMKEYSISTTANAYVSPYGAFAEYTIPSADITAGGWVTTVDVLTNSSTNFCAANFNSTTSKIFVYSKSAASLTVRVLFIKSKG